jgi:glycosyltransferase involved in cell wall biosynthesis/LPS sulfotransferase NodH/tetratricopeptide (TPR) repeat protein
VVRAAWPGDLGAAHALPLAYARGDWILSLDADEVLDADSRDRLPELARSGRHDGYTLPVRNYVDGWPFPKWRWADTADPLARGAVGYIPTEPVRLFRRREGVGYSGRLHQSVRPAIEALGGTVGDAGVPIHHYGFQRPDRQKTDLYRRLALQQTLDEPASPRAWNELGVVLAGDGRLADALAAFRTARSLGDRAAGSFHLGAALVELGELRAGVRFLRESIRHAPGDESLFYERADAWEALATAEDMAGRARAAERAYRSALRLRPDSPGALNNLAALLVDCGALDEAEELLWRLLARQHGSGVAWATLGALLLRRGDLEAARKTLETALGIRPNSVAVLSNLALAHARAGRREEAARLRASVRERLGSDEARRLGLDGGARPAEAVVTRAARHRPRSDLVVSVIATLGGGAGRVLVDVVRSLEGRPHLVACAEPSTHLGQGLRPELEAAGAEVAVISSEHDLELLLRRARPRTVVHHWWARTFLAGARRVARERWICVGHAPLPMPAGYDRYVVISGFHRRFQRHLPPQRIVEIPNGIDLARVPPRRRRESEERPVTIVMLSRLEPGKFPRRLLEYLPRLDGARLLVAGWGSRRVELEHELAERGLEDRIRFVGTIASADVPRFLADADIGLHLTDLGEELFCMAVLEMLAAGLPVVAEPKGALPELIVDGRNGFLASDEAEVADRLDRLLRSPELRRRLGASSRRTARRYDHARFRSSWRTLVEDAERSPVLPTPRRGGHLPASRSRKLSYAVCGIPGSGGSLLCAVLGGTGVAGHPDEFFEPGTLRTLAGRFAASDFGAYLGELYERTSTPNGVFGVELTSDVLPEVVAGLRAPVRDALAGLGYVHVTRRDRLAQAVSWVRDEQSPRFDRRAIERRLRAIEEAEAAWAEFFAAARVEPVRVTYEELIADYEGTARRVLTGLGIRVPRPLWLAPPIALPQVDGVGERWVERFTRPARAAARARPRSRPARRTTR